MGFNLSQSDLKKLADTVADVNHQREKNVKCSMEIDLDGIPAKVYHMGKDNPIVRIDIKVGVKHGT